MTTDFLVSPELEAIVIDPNYKNRKGYNADFLEVTVPLPKLSTAQFAQASKLFGTDDAVELKYHHFSIVQNGFRKLPFFTAVNFDGIQYNRIKDHIPSRKEIGKDRWFIDPRINPEEQLVKKFYDGNDFDLGHLVRREDPVWGKTVAFAIKANNDTFHLTNASPQHHDFNTNAERWLGLENYMLANARVNRLRVSVFTGPVFDERDRVFENVKNGVEAIVPAQFWKVLVIIKENGKPSATGYVVTQYDLIDDLFLETFKYGAFKTYQVSLRKIQQLTGLSFDLEDGKSLLDFDPLEQNRNNFEREGYSVDAPRLISRNVDIIL